jgi:NAD(P)H-nitrite reductase large subunit
MKNDFERQIDQWRDIAICDNTNLSNEVLICECFCVSVGDIRKCFSSVEDFDAKVLEEKFGFSTGCSSCLKDIDSKLKDILDERSC